MLVASNLVEVIKEKKNLALDSYVPRPCASGCLDKYGNWGFVSVIYTKDNVPEGKLRMLDVDNRAVLPFKKRVKVLVTSVDVIHS